MQKLNVIYEDNHIIVVEKIVNVPSQQDKTGDIDMLTIIKAYLREKYNKPGNIYLGLVHRLDRPVGGVMVFAKTSKAAARLSEAVRTKQFEKMYLVIVDGKMEYNKGILEDYLLKNERTNLSQVVKENTKNAKYAKLEYEVIKYQEDINLSLVKVKLYTGRHHQIRVQFANSGHSIYGDQKYGTRGRGKHPTIKQWQTYKCLPKKEGSWKILDEIDEKLI